MIAISRLIVALTLALLAFSTAAIAQDSHAGHYYPEPQSVELYNSPFPLLPSAGTRTRVGFTVGLNARQLKRGYAPTYHLFAKGNDAEKLIIVATGDGRYDTLYRMRGLLAAMTAEARLSPLFQQLSQPENINFFDLVKMTGFKQITVSDGRSFAHRIDLR